MSLEFVHISHQTVRDTVNKNILPELEFGLLKRYADELRLGTEEKAILLEMSIDQLEARQDSFVLQVTVRSLCHSRSVTADYLNFGERFNMKKNILCIGDVGNVESPWAQLLQPAVYMFRHEYNVIFIESPSLGKSPQRWLKYGCSLLRGCLKFLKVSSVNVLCTGSGGVLLHQLLADSPEILANTHIAFNLDMPAAIKALPFEIVRIEEALRENDIQMWCMYEDDSDEEAPGAFNRLKPSATKMYDALSKVQARLESDRKRAASNPDIAPRNFDEILFSNQMNVGAEKRVWRVPVSKMRLVVFEEEALAKMVSYLQTFPSTFQDDVIDGLVKDMLDIFREDITEKVDLPSIKNVNLNRDQEARKKMAQKNRERLNRLQEGVQQMALGSIREQQALAPPVETTQTLQAMPRKGSRTASKKQRSKSNLTVVSEDEGGLAEADDEDDEEDNFFSNDTSAEAYEAQWKMLQDMRADPSARSGHKAPTTSTLVAIEDAGAASNS
eukprot:TRINITY_DN20089_c0_g1_i1.p1 TRINITY_DN20089_c0_g1~~TRINITY_DN20089_c0_g1_i1.p1  ORF type:complete len:500 (+),score=125.18 TRINITY_DN20089_c0_g1_i1:119-1618(+)